MRNDLATVAENIQVTRFRYVEEIRTELGAILQTSSEICGELTENWQAQIGTILASLLPAGSISGARKKKLCKSFKKRKIDLAGITRAFLVFSMANPCKAP